MTEPGQWAGGFGAWGSADDHAVYLATGTAVASGRCFVVPAQELREFVGKWLPLARHILDAAFQQVRRFEADTRHRESLMALGELAARLAHEINNPASASLRAVESLRSTSGYMLQSLVELAEQGVTADEFLVLDRIREDLQQRQPAPETTIETADREEAIGLWMEDRNVDLAWRLAPVLATKGADSEWLESVRAVVSDDGLAPALQWISSTTGAYALLSELEDAIGRVAHLVQDVKTYSQMDRASLQCVDLPSGLDSTLVMLGSKMDGVDIVRDYDPDVPAIEVYAAELNQVWTNLIDNAIDAIGGDGTLRLATSVDGDHVMIAITDSGPGIDPAILHRVFEPFFTTKDVGSGTGLGLDITRRIVVDRHGGTIEFDSEPGSTTVKVRLPLRR
jgi:signal transduction histidine kinase